jgi:hypothetical protein
MQQISSRNKKMKEKMKSKPQYTTLEDLKKGNSLKDKLKDIARQAYQFAMTQQRAEAGIKLNAQQEFEKWLEDTLK